MEEEEEKEENIEYIEREMYSKRYIHVDISGVNKSVCVGGRRWEEGGEKQRKSTRIERFLIAVGHSLEQFVFIPTNFEKLC